MRHVLIDHARSKRAAKRGGGHIVLSLEEDAAPPAPGSVDLLALDESLTRLEALDVRHARVAEMRFFTGLSVEEIARALGLSSSTVRADLSMAQAWLSRELAPRK